MIFYVIGKTYAKIFKAYKLHGNTILALLFLLGCTDRVYQPPVSALTVYISLLYLH